MSRLDPEIRRARARWRWRGQARPPFAEAPAPGGESVWDYPRPPRLEPEIRPLRVEHAGALVAESRAALRLLETASPPTLYVPASDVRRELLELSPTRSVCEWKGVAQHWTLKVGDRASADAAWSYEGPFPEYAALRGHLAFHPARVDRCTLGDERVTPQPGGYYAGWITSELAGPFKGDAGSEEW